MAYVSVVRARQVLLKYFHGEGEVPVFLRWSLAVLFGISSAQAGDISLGEDLTVNRLDWQVTLHQ